jgi:hypothetical protein
VSGPTTTDWIGLFHQGDPNTSYIDREYDDSCTNVAGAGTLAAGSCSFPMPAVAGTYELRLLANDGFATVYATSGPIMVTAGGSASVTASPTPVAPGGSETVSFSGVSNPTTKDWIGLYPTGAPSTTRGLAWLYDGPCSQTIGRRTAAISSGTCTFAMPQTTGTYEFRLFANDGFTLLGTSNTVTVQSTRRH